jgi:cytochrome b
MAGILAVVFFLVAFILYLAKSKTGIPWTTEGFVLLGLIALAVHLAWGWWGTYRDRGRTAA